MGDLIEFEHIGKRFYKNGKGVQALQDVHFSVKKGEFLAVVGPSGCGKSTLLNMTAGLMAPTNGAVKYGGQPVSAVNTAAGYVTQRDNLLPWRSVRGNVAIALEVRGTPRSKHRQLVDDVIRNVGLTGFEDHYPGELSGGMRKRVTLARTLVYSPETLLMDEPFAALDAQLKLILQGELLQLWDAQHKTIIFVTHDLSEAVTVADRVVVLSPRPSRVKLIQEVDLPRPRDVFNIRFTERFAQISELIWAQMQEDIRKGEDV
ncbi:MAG: ABC transporter ATP-binding protein [Chloroflexota bacterium]|nr:ABC transporter ATP-binding protein [Chloroflexota bacterium]